jgi:hypothetical protein
MAKPHCKRHEIALSEEAVIALTKIAKRNKQSLDTAFQQALVNENRIEEALEDDGELLLKKGQKIQELFYENA